MQTNNKLREALETLLNLAYEVQDANSEYGPKTSVPTQFVIDVAKSALAEPVKNCEVGTPEEQANRWYWRYHVGHLCQSCPLGPRKWSDIGAGWFCFSEWLQMPYEEGGEK